LKIKLKDNISSKTSNGMLSKAWYEIDGGIYLVKGNSDFGNGKYGYEPYSEVIAGAIAECLGICHIPYKLADAELFKEIKTYKCDFVSVCPKYTKPKNFQTLTAYEYTDFTAGKEVSDYWSGITAAIQNNKELINRLIQMLLFDAIIGNTDRHLSNWEYMVDNKGNVSMTPIYDNGGSLLFDVQENELSLNFKIGKDISKPFKNTHTKQTALIKKWYPNYKISVNTINLWNRIETNIMPYLNKLSEKRKRVLLKYIKNRLDYYIGKFI